MQPEVMQHTQMQIIGRGGKRLQAERPSSQGLRYRQRGSIYRQQEPEQHPVTHRNSSTKPASRCRPEGAIGHQRSHAHGFRCPTSHATCRSAGRTPRPIACRALRRMCTRNHVMRHICTGTGSPLPHLPRDHGTRRRVVRPSASALTRAARACSPPPLIARRASAQ